ncbi:MAG: GTPase HflX [Firmicutes bacterium]|nr:GTPase HflX [Bacillota bacterium]
MLRFTDDNEILREDSYRGIVAGVQWRGDIERSMDELEGLCEADGIQVVGRLEQSLERPNSATLIGKGKVEELKDLCESMEVDTVVFNEELSGIQIRNLEEALGVRVIDRTILILDIFADRAVSKEGKLQVELAQLKYRLPRLTGFGRSLSRLGGGIGTRGPGEKKLETDRRHIARRIDDIREELAKAGKSRQTQKSGRAKSGMPVVALVGYTNSGKSAIMNRLLDMFEEETAAGLTENKKVGSEDMLFATLDTAHRKLSLGKGMDFILIDTVGFVSGLPHDLVDAFKSTLEEVKDADVLVHVVDNSREDKDFQIEVTGNVIRQLGAGGAYTIMAYNKIDIAPEEPMITGGDDAVFISARTGDGMDALADAIRKAIFSDMVSVSLLIPYDKGSIVSYLCENGQIDSMDYKENGTLLTGTFREADYNKYRSYSI